MQNTYRKVFFLATILVLLVGLSAISAASIDDNTTAAGSHVNVEKHADTGIVKEDTKIVSSDNKNTVKEDKKTTNKKVKTSTQHDYYVSASGDDSEDGSSSTPYKTINQAISQATSTSDTYNIHIKEGTYTGTGNTNLTVNGNYNINLIGDGINKTVIDGEVQYTEGSAGVWGNDPNFNSYNITYGNWGMNITNGNGRITISNLNIQHMVSRGGSDINAYPTATVDNHATLSVDNVYFYDNLAGVGAGIRNNNDGSLTVTNSIFEANRKSSTTGNYGAGIYNNGTATISDSQFIGNIARWGTVTNDHTIDIVNCTFRDGIAYNAASTFKYGSAIASNTGESNYFNRYNGTSGLVTNVINSTFINNQQTDIYQGQGNLLVNGCKFESSTGIYIAAETVTNASFSHIIENSSFNNMIPSSVLYSWFNNKNMTFAVYDLSQSSTTITNNNISTSSDAYALYLNNSNTVTDNSINGYIYIIGNNSILQTNNIISENRTYTIELTNNTYNNIITNNNLLASIFTGDESVKTVNTNNIVANNTGNRAKNVTVTEENYLDYFDSGGELLPSEVPDGSTLIFDSLSNKDISITHSKIYITSKEGTSLTNCSVSSTIDAQVTIHGLNMNNGYELSDCIIDLESDYNTIEDCVINSTTVTPIYVASNHNIIYNNTIITDRASPITSIVIESADNNISQNNITATSTQGTLQSILLNGNEATRNIITDNRITIEYSNNSVAINLIKSNNNTIGNNNINMISENNAVGINVENADNNEIKSIITINHGKTAQGVFILNGTGNKINGIETNITATTPNAIKLYNTNNTIITANDTTNYYTLYSDDIIMMDIQEANNTHISYIKPKLIGKGLAFLVINSYNTSIEAVNCTNTTSDLEDNQYVVYAHVVNSNGIYIGRLVRDNYTQSAIINATSDIEAPITLIHSENIEINSIDIYTYNIYTIVLLSTNNTLITNNTLMSYNTTATGYKTIYEEETTNTTYEEKETTTNAVKQINNKYFKSKNLKTEDETEEEMENVLESFIEIDSIDPNPSPQGGLIIINGSVYAIVNGEKIKANDKAIYVTADESTTINYPRDRAGHILNAIRTENSTFSFNVTASIIPGVHNITLVYKSRPVYTGSYNFTSSSAVINYTVAGSKGDKNTTLDINISDINLGKNATINITFLDAKNNNPVSGANLSLVIGNETPINITTDANGKYTYHYFLNSAKENITVTASFLGNDEYAFNQKKVTFDVKDDGPVTYTVNNYDEIYNIVSNVKAKQVIINLDKPVIDPFNLESYNQVYNVNRALDIISGNVVINGNNQVLMGKTSYFMNTNKGFNLTLNNLRIANFSGEVFRFAPYYADGSVSLILNNVTFENNTGSSIINPGRMPGNISLINCTIFGTQQAIFQSASRWGTAMVADVTVDNCYIEGSVNDKSNFLTHNTTITLQVPSTINVDDATVINGTLLNDMGGPGKGLNVTLYVDGKTAVVTTDSNGKFNYTYTPQSIKDNVNISARFISTDYHNYAYNRSTASALCDVKLADTNISNIIITNVSVNGTTNIYGNLIDERNTPITNATISININNKTYNTTTNDNGVFNTTLTAPGIPGVYAVTISYNGSYKYNTTINTINLTVNKINTKIIIKPISKDNITVIGQVMDEKGNIIPNKTVNVTYENMTTTTTTNNNGIYTVNFTVNSSKVKSGGNITLTGKLIDENSNTLSNTNITVNFENTTATTTTDDNGTFSITLTAPKTIRTYDLIVSYQGNEVYNKTGNTLNITVEKLETNIKLDPVTPVKTGRNITVTGKVTDETDTAIPDAQLNIIAENRTYTATADNNGTFNTSILVTGAGVHEVTVIYSGDSEHTASNMTGNYTVNKQDTNIVIDPVNTIIGENMSVTAHVTDEDNKTVTGGQVFFKVNGKTLKDINGNNIYADVINGTAVMNYPVNSMKINNITAVYTGSENYNTIRSTTPVQIERTNATMKLEILNPNIKSGETAIIKVTLTDKYANLINSGKVIFKLNGKTIKDANNQTITVRIHNGEAIFNYAVPSDYSAKNYTLTAISVGNTYNRVEAATNLTLTKINTYIQPVNIQFTGNTLQVRANIISTTTLENTAYRTTKVSIKINNKTFTKEAVITNGTIDLNIDTSSIGRGNYKITIKAGENGIYKGTQLDTYTYKAPVKQALNQTSNNGTLVKA